MANFQLILDPTPTRALRLPDPQQRSYSQLSCYSSVHHPQKSLSLHMNTLDLLRATDIYQADIV